VLDFLEDLAFYENGDQISPEVAHHHSLTDEQISIFLTEEIALSPQANE